jgi:transcription-repair coupling factor (superfamily II helicase)
MDRLLCGDVGFGKTEVAMRAAFKRRGLGYQVAVLAPTTILADQHLETFRKRFAGFPVKSRCISRFAGRKEVARAQASASPTARWTSWSAPTSVLSRDIGSAASGW